MNVLIPCAHCDRYVRSHEQRCPFCQGALAQPQKAAARALLRSAGGGSVGGRNPRVRNPSRAAAFALRTALVVAPAALACGSDGTVERDADEVASNGGSGGSAAGAQGGGAGSSAGNGGSGAAQGGAGSSAGAGSAGSGGALASAGDAGNADGDGSETDAGDPDAGFVPVPIYGGVFPDPMTRVRV